MNDTQWLLRHMLVEAFNEYDLSHADWSNVIHLGHATFDDVMQLFYEGNSAKTSEEKEKMAALVKTTGTVLGRHIVIHDDIPRMMIADYREGLVGLKDEYPKEFLSRPSTIARLAAAAEKHHRLAAAASSVIRAKINERQPVEPELADTKG